MPPARSSDRPSEEEIADRFYASAAWLSNQAALKIWLIHHGSIRTAFRVQGAVNQHLEGWTGVNAEHMREIFVMGMKLAHDKLMGGTDVV